MLSQRHRFHGNNSLRGVYARGSSVRAPLITGRFLQRGTGKPYRVAVVVSRKVSKSAVVRNRIRRRIYEIVRSQEQLIVPGTDIVLSVFDEQLATRPIEDLQATIKELLEKIAAQLNGATTAASHGIVKPDISEKGTNK